MKREREMKEEDGMEKSKKRRGNKEARGQVKFGTQDRVKRTASVT